MLFLHAMGAGATDLLIGAMRHRLFSGEARGDSEEGVPQGQPPASKLLHMHQPRAAGALGGAQAARWRRQGDNRRRLRLWPGGGGLPGHRALRECTAAADGS